MLPRYCRGPDCDREAYRGELCPAHVKQQQRTGKLTPIAPQLSPVARVLEAAEAWVDSDPSNDREYESRRRALVNACVALGEKERAETEAREERERIDAIRQGITKAKRNGIRVGRPPKVTVEALRTALVRKNTQVAAARYLGISERTIRRMLTAHRDRK